MYFKVRTNSMCSTYTSQNACAISPNARRSVNDFYESHERQLEKCSSVPRIGGAHNPRYQSPTYKSNPLLYGEENIRSRPQEYFLSETQVGISRPRTRENNHEEFADRCQSTNKFAPYQNTFHLSKEGLNLKNFSQVDLGTNSNIENAYKKQFQSKKRNYDLQLQRQLGERCLSTDNIKPVRKQKEDFIENKPFQNPKVRHWDAAKQVSSNFQAKRASISRNQQIQQPLQYQKFERCLSPQPQKQDPGMMTQYNRYRVESPLTFVSAEVSRETPLARTHSAWCFFSPQPDPFKQAFEKRNAQRVASQEKVREDLVSFQQQDMGRRAKIALQNGDQNEFFDTLKGDTLKFAHEKRAKVVDRRKRAVEYYSQNEDLARSQVYELGEGGLEAKIGERKADQVRAMNLTHKQSLKHQIIGNLERKYHEQMIDSELHQQDIKAQTLVASKLRDLEERRKHQIKQDLLQSYQEAQCRKQIERAQKDHQRQLDRQMIDRANQAGLVIERERRCQAKEMRSIIGQHCQEVIQNKYISVKKPYQPLNQRINYGLAAHSFTPENLPFQPDMYKVDYLGGCGSSNASTLSSCSQQNVCKANISKGEYELRKKQLEKQKQMFTQYGKSKRQGNESQQKFTVKSSLIEKSPLKGRSKRL